MKNTFPLTISVILSIALNSISYAESGAASPIKNVHYRVSENRSGEKVAVHFFSFGCHHCYRFEPLMETWSEEKEVEIQRVPVTFGKKQWEHYAKIYFSLQILTGADEFTDELFAEIHKNRNKNLSINDLRSVLGLSGKQNEELSRLYSSEEVDRKLERARNLAKDYAITGVPAMVVKGQYVSDAAMARGVHGLIGVVDYLFDVDRRDS